MKPPRKFVSNSIAADDFTTDSEKHLRRFIAAVKNHKTPAGDPIPCDADTMQYLCAAFEQVLQGVPAEKALQLQTKQGKKRAHAKQAAHEKSLNIAIMVEEQIHAGSLPDEARQAVANELVLKYRAVRDHHKKNELLAKMYFESQALKVKK